MKKTNAAAALSKALSALGEAQAAQINVAFPCRVLAFDDVALMADVQPLIKVTDSEPAPILDVPVTGSRVMMDGTEKVLRPVLKTGDIVMVVCCDAEIKNTLSGQVATPDSERRHSRNDSVIVGLMPCCL